MCTIRGFPTVSTVRVCGPGPDDDRKRRSASRGPHEPVVGHLIIDHFSFFLELDNQLNSMISSGPTNMSASQPPADFGTAPALSAVRTDTNMAISKAKRTFITEGRDELFLVGEDLPGVSVER